MTAARFSIRVALFFWLIGPSFLFITGDAGAVEKPIANSLGMEFVLIQPGIFIMGSPLDEAYRDVAEV